MKHQLIFALFITHTLVAQQAMFHAHNVSPVAFACGGTLTINHTSGDVAPETKTVNYGTVTSSLSGASKCWITRNLGATNQASSALDYTVASAGWYWQFDRKQGYMIGPSPTWTITSISSGNWTSAQDPCTIELGAGWRIPTYTEWDNSNTNGSWNSYTDTYNSVLKLHAAGYLSVAAGVLNNNDRGFCWSSTSFSGSVGWFLDFTSAYSSMNGDDKALGLSIRCIKD